MVPAPLTYEPIGIALSPGDVHLINWVENFFRALQGSGVVDRLNARWLQDGSWLKRLP
jgi:ABC-type amino acid transport substrate-binding protein